MKSAYELAMERLKAEDPESVQELNEEQKGKIAEIEAKYKAKIAEREVFLQKTMESESAAGNTLEAEKIANQLRSEKEVLEEEMEGEKNKIRNSK